MIHSHFVYECLVFTHSVMLYLASTNHVQKSWFPNAGLRPSDYYCFSVLVVLSFVIP